VGTVNGDFTLDTFLLQALSGDGTINVEGTPQNKALSALQTSSSSFDPNDPGDQFEILQRYALNTLFFSTDGDNWESNNFWTSANNPCGTKNESDEIEGAWFGVECDSELRVVEKVTLDDNALRGTIPSEIRGLSRLNRLEISNNQLSGPLSESIGELTNLSVLDIGTNFFTGTVPLAIKNITSLLLLDISSNFLSGTIAGEISQLTKLLSLSAQSNFFAGTLPSELFGIAPLSKFRCKL